MQTGTFQDSDFAGDLGDSKSTSGGTLSSFGCHTFVPKNWMCKQQTSVSHSWTESEIISLDAGLRLDGILLSIYGIWLFLSLETRFRLLKELGSPVFSVIKTEVPLNCDDPVNQDLLLQQYGERTEKLTLQDKLRNFCMDTGFLNVVEIGQYFRMKDTADLSQFHAVACREYTLPTEEPASQAKGWIRGKTKIGPVWEVATSYLHGKYGVEIRIWFLNSDNTHSWVRISYGSNKFVMNLNNNEQEVPEVQLEEYVWKLDAKDFASRSQAKAKPQRRELAGSSLRIVSIGKRTWTDIEPGNFFSDYEVSNEENNVFSSSFTKSPSRRRWSGSFLENQRKSSKSVPTLSSLVWQ